MRSLAWIPAGIHCMMRFGLVPNDSKQLRADQKGYKNLSYPVERSSSELPTCHWNYDALDWRVKFMTHKLWQSDKRLVWWKRLARPLEWRWWSSNWFCLGLLATMRFLARIHRDRLYSCHHDRYHKWFMNTIDGFPVCVEHSLIKKNCSHLCTFCAKSDQNSRSNSVSRTQIRSITKPQNMAIWICSSEQPDLLVRTPPEKNRVPHRAARTGARKLGEHTFGEPYRPHFQWSVIMSLNC